MAALGAVASSGSQWVSALFRSQEMPGLRSQLSFICIIRVCVSTHFALPSSVLWALDSEQIFDINYETLDQRMKMVIYP